MVLELLKEETTQIEISSKYGIPPGTLRGWYNHFLNNSESVFAGRQQDKKYRETLKEKEKEIEELHKKIGELTVSVD